MVPVTLEVRGFNPRPGKTWINWENDVKKDQWDYWLLKAQLRMANESVNIIIILFTLMLLLAGSKPMTL